MVSSAVTVEPFPFVPATVITLQFGRCKFNFCATVKTLVKPSCISWVFLVSK
ncbi:hypothetical protein LPE509_01862 [Legionella pneumophila subsp. pneumophila LPE509]|nr:hypothetical protein LPE509_01862 [Legionella pneumophila subsp. pneumophila LPE509]